MADADPAAGPAREPEPEPEPEPDETEGVVGHHIGHGWIELEAGGVVATELTTAYVYSVIARFDRDYAPGRATVGVVHRSDIIGKFDHDLAFTYVIDGMETRDSYKMFVGSAYIILACRELRFDVVRTNQFAAGYGAYETCAIAVPIRAVRCMSPDTLADIFSPRVRQLDLYAQKHLGAPTAESVWKYRDVGIAWASTAHTDLYKRKMSEFHAQFIDRLNVGIDQIVSLDDDEHGRFAPACEFSWGTVEPGLAGKAILSTQHLDGLEDEAHHTVVLANAEACGLVVHVKVNAGQYGLHKIFTVEIPTMAVLNDSRSVANVFQPDHGEVLARMAEVEALDAAAAMEEDDIYDD